MIVQHLHNVAQPVLCKGRNCFSKTKCHGKGKARPHCSWPAANVKCGMRIYDKRGPFGHTTCSVSTRSASIPSFHLRLLLFFHNTQDHPRHALTRSHVLSATKLNLKRNKHPSTVRTHRRSLHSPPNNKESSPPFASSQLPIPSTSAVRA
jgi:hypothetical protein